LVLPNRSGSMVFSLLGASLIIKRSSGNPRSYIGRSPTRYIEHFVLLFNQMLASGHHREYDAPT
jgi:hypothetical protein